MDLDRLVPKLMAIDGVETVVLGGSRASGTHTPSSDWDIGVYYRDTIDVAAVRALGYSGTVVEPGEWGRIMNGGAWLRVEDEPVDILYRDLDAVEQWTAAATEGRFEIDRLPGYLAGIPTYTLTGEVAIARHLAGVHLATPVFSDALRDHAAFVWRFNASFHLAQAALYAAAQRRLQCVGSVARAAVEEAHARVASRGVWVLNEKRLLVAAGLTAADELAGIVDLREMVDAAAHLLDVPVQGRVDSQS